jgi:osmotically-inducible protein OsmY
MALRYPQIVESVNSALQEDPRTEGAAIEVVCAGGVVTLTGTVSQEEAREAAEEITRQQEGVVEVINDLDIEQGWEVPGIPPQRPPNYNI